MTAKGRIGYVKRSIQCFCDQTYSNKELLIVNEGPKEYQAEIQEHVQRLERTDIRTLWLDGKYTLGSLRNISMGMADGDLWCQWDDDDFCAPNRLSTQYAFMATYPSAQACYLGDQLHYYFHTGHLFWDNWKRYCSGNTMKWSLIPGTIMARRNLRVKYPTSGKHCSAGEDSIFADALLEKYEHQVILMCNVGYMHVYTFHGTNQVYDIDHHLNISKLRSQPREAIVRYKDQICGTLRYLNLPGDIKVMCRDGLVFTYRQDDAELPEN